MAVVRAQELASSSTTTSCNQVFLSFRGADTRKAFTSHLYAALVRAGFDTFRDDDKIHVGEKIKSELERGIRQSRASIIVFSKDYVSSRWCLDELVMILECKRAWGQVVLPVFYDVDPSDVRHQSGNIGKSFARFEEKLNQEVDEERKKEAINKLKVWREALKEAADLAGMVLNKYRDEARLIQDVVNVTRAKLSHNVFSVTPSIVGPQYQDNYVRKHSEASYVAPSVIGLQYQANYVGKRSEAFYVASYFGGMHSQAKRIDLWLHDESTDVSTMVICGMDGIGKTTIAKYVYNLNVGRFDGTSFLANIRETSERPTGIIGLLSQLISDICKRKAEKIQNINEGIDKLRNVIYSKRILLVLDDVDHYDQIYSILGIRELLSAGSKIIITTRHRLFLKAYKVYRLYIVEPLDCHESIELFSVHAFGQDHPPEIYREYTNWVVPYFQGIPLVAKVLGSCLSGKSVYEWKREMEKIAVTDRSINAMLKISFDCLQNKNVKEIFLLIACFFAGEDMDYTVEVLDAFDLPTRFGIEHLMDRCLLEIDHNDKLRMHQLIRDMGREVAQQESPEPGKRSKAWHQMDCFRILNEKTGTGTVEAMAFDMRLCKKDVQMSLMLNANNSRRHHFTDFLSNLFGRINAAKTLVSDFLSWHLVDSTIRDSVDINLETDAFARMQRLKLLQLNYVKLTGTYKNFPAKLRWLCWHGFHLESLPDELSLGSLVLLDLQYSNLTHVWKGIKILGELRVLNLSHSTWLTRTPDFSGLPNLERLILKGCISLVEICESIEFVEGLMVLNLKDCKRLTKLPRNLSKLRMLQTLNISGCSNLCEFPTVLRHMTSLIKFKAHGTILDALQAHFGSIAPTRKVIMVPPQRRISEIESHQRHRSGIFAFKSLSPPAFMGSTEPLDADNWLQEMEKAFTVVRCTDTEKVTYAAYMLQGSAYDWWLSEERGHKHGTKPYTWTMFKNAFYKEYFPIGVRLQKERDFILLKQGSMSVAQYEVEFSRLSRYAKALVADEEIRARRFEDGLCPRIKQEVMPFEFPTYDQVVRKALLIESDPVAKPHTGLTPIDFL